MTLVYVVCFIEIKIKLYLTGSYCFTDAEQFHKNNIKLSFNVDWFTNMVLARIVFECWQFYVKTWKIW